MSLTRNKRKIKTEPVKVREPKGRPKCREHRVPMEFDRSRMVWHCTFYGCKQIAHPANDLGGSKPAVFTGPFELMNMFDPDEGEWRWLIKCDKVYFDVTNALVSSYQNKNGRYLASFEFDTFLKLDGEGNLIE